ncbi:MAG: arginase family protein, partial [Candidatus Angelobacter sp.]
ISMDINVLDPVYAPGSSTPSPGGLTPEEMRMVLRVIADNHRIVGCDLCEVNPRLDPGFLTLIHAYRMLTVCLAASVSGNAAKHPEARAVLEQTSSR